jgi:hypothetical protein
MLPEGVLEDDGADRGILFFCLQANLARGFEFVKTQWINEGTFFGTPPEMDPLVGPNEGTRMFTVPQQPIRRRLTELPQFVVNRGGEYLFMPGLRALRWIATSETQAEPQARAPGPVSPSAANSRRGTLADELAAQVMDVVVIGAGPSA